jgi:hypothetical protein
MVKKIFISFLTSLACISCFAFFRISEKKHLELSKESISQKWNGAKPDRALLHTGDLIFRQGRGAISNALMFFSRRDAKYSHAGIISIEYEKVFVYHAIGGEENVSNKLRKDPLEVFCNPASVHSFGIYRLDLSPQQLQDVDSTAKECFRQGLEFDTKFDLDTDEKMYCTEFVYKAITKITGQRNYLPMSAVSGINYVSCDDLYLNSHSSFIYSYHY